MHEIYHNLIIDTSVAKVFAAVTLPEHINNWWTKKCAGEPQIGASYMFWFAPEFDWSATVTEFNQDASIVYTFTKADEDWTETELSFQLEKIEEKKTRLHFYHSNWESANDHFGRTSYCWAMYLKALKAYLENQIVLSYEDRGGS